MKLLLLAATGQEPSYLAIRSALDHIGAPYQVALLAKGDNLPPLSDGGTGLYQAIFLATGNLGVCDPNCRSALDPQQWARLDQYAAEYSVRTVSLFTFPEARYGLSYREGVLVRLDSPAVLDWAPDAGGVFPYLRQEEPVRVAGAFTYLAEAAPGPGETTTPVFRWGDKIVGALHTKADGREYLALMFDQSPSLRHSLTLGYGLISWATRGLFLGSRRVYLIPQADDLFLANNLYTRESGPCGSNQFVVNPTAPLAPDCPKLRITARDLINLREWQALWNAEPQTAQFAVTMAYNGMGAKPDGDDDLTAEVRKSFLSFYWVNHTYTHKILDCYASNPDGSCRPANYGESAIELRRNLDTAGQLGMPVDGISVITPAVSGLTNREFLQAASDAGIRYLVCDTSRPEGNPAIPNTGIRPPDNPELLFIPRRATNVFYNTSTPDENVIGSLTDEYNFFFGPDGIVRVGGPDGPPFFANAQTYDQIVDRESDALLTFMLRYEMYPSMFHQSNFYTYRGTRSLFIDTLDMTLRKFATISRLPVLSVAQSEIGKLLEQRMAWLASGARVTLVPGESIRIAVEHPAMIPVTGLCADGCEEYGGEWQSRIAAEPGASVTIPLK